MKFNNNLKIIGLMSGTSCDGLDIALVEISGFSEKTSFQFINGKTVSYSPAQRALLIDFISTDKIELKAVSQLNFYLPKVWSEMILNFLNEIGLNTSDIDLIGSHGQTVWHQPETEEFEGKQISSTLQIGDPAVLAQLLDITVVGDFRVADVTVGGQGAPLISYFDWILLKDVGENILSVNIGGISNFTYIPQDGDVSKVEALDCGPGNVLIDMAMQKLFNKPYDENGKVATSGALSEELFHFIISNDEFVNMALPKSTGREQYDLRFIEKLLKFAADNNISRENVIHTISSYTAYAIFKNYQLFIKHIAIIDELIISGGGLYNEFVISKLEEYFKDIEVRPITDYGIDNDLKEAIGFAILANETIQSQPSNIPNVTGAKRSAILGKICRVRVEKVVCAEQF